MSKISGKDLLKALVDDGWRMINRDGSHVQLQKYDRQVTIPLYHEVHDNMLHFISTQVGCSKNELIQMVKSK